MALYKSNKYKGLYEVEQMEEILKIMKIHGTGPKGNSMHRLGQKVSMHRLGPQICPSRKSRLEGRPNNLGRM